MADSQTSAPQVNAGGNAALAALTNLLANAVSAQKAQEAQDAPKLDTTIRGGKYLLSDGKTLVNANGQKINDDGSLVDAGEASPLAVPVSQVVAQMSDAELRQMEALIAQRRAGAQTDEKGQPLSTVDPTGTGTGTGTGTEDTDFKSMELDDLKAEVEKRKLTVKGTGAGGNVLKKDMVAALEKATGQSK